MKMNLRMNPNTEEVFLDDKAFNIIYTFGGVPHQRPEGVDDWPVVGGDVPCLFDWQTSPAKHGTIHFVSWLRCNSEVFSAGGNRLVIENWAEERGATVTHLAAYHGRNAARANAEVQW